MSDFDAFDDFNSPDDSDHLPSDQLIHELESIKVLLHSDDHDDDGDATASTADIPLLDDMVINDLDANARLLNLNCIFEGESEEDQEAEPAAPLPAIAPRADVPFPRFQLDTMLTDDAARPDAPTKPALSPTLSPPHSPAHSQPHSSPHSPPHSPPQKCPIAAVRVRPDYSRDVLIQELVDEFVPQIEAALRERLNQLDNAALQQWKDRD